MDNRHETNLEPHVNLICRVCGKIQDFGKGIAIPRGKRLGPNYHLIPVNAPKYAPENSYDHYGLMRTDSNGGGAPNYWPNSFGGPAPDPSAREPAFELSG